MPHVPTQVYRFLLPQYRNERHGSFFEASSLAVVMPAHADTGGATR